MNSYYKYLIAGCMILMQQASAQQPVKPDAPAKPEAPHAPFAAELKTQLDNAMRSAERELNEAKVKLNGLKIREKSLSMLHADHLKSLQRNFEDGSSTKGLQPSAVVSEKEKKITRSYKVNSKDKLSIDNQFGRVTVNTWDKKEIKVDIIVKSFDSSDDGAQRLLDDVSIEEGKSDNLITFKTLINRGKSSSLWDAFKRKVASGQKRGVEVFYVVYMPSGNPLTISNSYGSIILPDFQGPVNLTSGYSSLKSGSLENKQNQLSIKYGSADIEGFSGGLKLSYGSLKLNRAGTLNGTISYGSASIGKITDASKLDIKYTSKFTISEVDQTVERLDIAAAYSGIILGLKESAKYNYDVTVSFGGFNYDNQLTSPVISPASDSKHFNPTKNYKGTYGKGSKLSQINIRSNYGSVNFQ